MRTFLEYARAVVVNLFFYAVGLGVFAFAVSSCTDQEKDNTDPLDGRSGLYLRTDSLTGCQYLSEPRGGITPRPDGAGRHVGCKGGA
jgi:hypothetical protein